MNGPHHCWHSEAALRRPSRAWNGATAESPDDLCLPRWIESTSWAHFAANDYEQAGSGAQRVLARDIGFIGRRIQTQACRWLPWDTVKFNGAVALFDHRTRLASLHLVIDAFAYRDRKPPSDRSGVGTSVLPAGVQPGRNL